MLQLLFYFTDFERLITFYLFKVILGNVLQKAKNIFFSFYHSLTLHTGLVKTRATLRDSVRFSDILDLDLKSPWTTFTGVRLILWYSGLGLKKHLDYLTGIDLILLYIEFGLRINQMNRSSRDVIRKVWRHSLIIR